MNKIYCVGEALIDMYDATPRVGGAPANVAACVAKLGGECAFVGGISNDDYGKMIYDALKELGVDMSYAKIKSAPTAIARVTLEAGERKFTFFRQDTADLSLAPSDIENISFKKGDILHFCSNCLMHDGMRELHARLIKSAKAAGAVISYDVNLRPSLWQDEQTMLKIASAFLPFADIVKASEEEKDALFNDRLCDSTSPSLKGNCAKSFFDICSSASCLIETNGGKGARCYFAEDAREDRMDERDVFLFPALNPSPKDTTGAGDCFIGATLAELARGGSLSKKQDVLSALDFATRVAAISVSKWGAIASYPSSEEVAASKYAR